VRLAVRCRSADVCLALSPLPERGGRGRDHQPGDRDSLASAGFQGLLAMEVSIQKRPSSDPREIRDLIREMSRANSLWGAPRIHGELLKLGIEVAQSTVGKYMIKRPRRPGQSWTTFLCNHATGIAPVDMFVVPTIGFKLLYCLVFLAHGRRELVHHAVTRIQRPIGLLGR